MAIGKWEDSVGIDYRVHKQGLKEYEKYGPISVILRSSDEGKYSNTGKLTAKDCLIEALKYADELTANDVKDDSGKVIKPAGQKVQLNRSFFNVDAIAANPKCALYISNFFGKPNVTPISAKSKTNKRALR
tara:strand:- start:399 stop:791 length:393 start_codon:yes stop_codon:yes gene_type:complete